MFDFGDKSIDLTVSSRVQRLNGMLERASERLSISLTSAQRPSDRMCIRVHDRSSVSPTCTTLSSVSSPRRLSSDRTAS